MNSVTKKLLLFKEGFKIGLKDLKLKFTGYPSFGDDPGKICKEILNRCVEAKLINTGLGHFRNFWVRDIGVFAESMVREGYKGDLKRSLRNSLEIFKRNGKTTTSIFGSYPVNYHHQDHRFGSGFRRSLN